MRHKSSVARVARMREQDIGALSRNGQHIAGRDWWE